MFNLYINIEKPGNCLHRWSPGKNEKRRKKEFGMQPVINSLEFEKMSCCLIFIVKSD
jgi:hypothetical protein